MNLHSFVGVSPERKQLLSHLAHIVAKDQFSRRSPKHYPANFGKTWQTKDRLKLDTSYDRERRIIEAKTNLKLKSDVNAENQKLNSYLLHPNDISNQKINYPILQCKTFDNNCLS